MFLDSIQPPERTIYHQLHDVLLRVIAIGLIFLSLVAWLRIVGLGESMDPQIGVAGWRFDLMPMRWRLVVLVMAVIGPVAAVGLWMLSAWGVVLWFGLTLFQIAIFAVFTQTFEPLPLLVAAHAVCLSAYIFLRVRIEILERRHRLS